MKKVTKILIAISILGIIFTSCGKNSEEKTKEKVVKIRFSTASTTGTAYPLGSAICNIWNTKLKNIKASAQASNGGIENLNLVADQEAEIGIAVTSILYENYIGESSFKGRANKNVRILAGLYYNPNQITVSENSGINSLSDLKGKSFAPGSAGGTTEIETRTHLKDGIGINYPNDIRAQYVGATEAIDLMRNKQIDGLWVMAGIPTSSIAELTSTTGAKLISIEDDIIEKLQIKYPWYSKFIIPAGTYKGQHTDVVTSAIKLTIFTDARMSEEVIYKLTKSFWENIDSLKFNLGILQDVEVKKAVTDLAGIPLHKGAEKYYKEIGIIK